MDRVYTDKPLKVLYALAFAASVVAVWAVVSKQREAGIIGVVAVAFVALALIEQAACNRTIVVTDADVTVTRVRRTPTALRFADVVAAVEGVRGGFAHTGSGTPIRWPAAQGFPVHSANLKGLALFEVPSPARGRTRRALRDDIRQTLAAHAVSSNTPQNRPTTGMP